MALPFDTASASDPAFWPRQVAVRVTGEFLAAWWTPYADDNPDEAPFVAVRCNSGLPPGARCVGADWSFERGELFVIFEHETFATVAPGQRRPEILPRFMRQASRMCCWGHDCAECAGAKP